MTKYQAMWSCICVLGVSSHDREWSCICVLGGQAMTESFHVFV